MLKKGQLTLFIIIAIVVITLVIGSWFFYQSYQKAKQERITKEVAPIKDYVENCLKLTAIDAIEFVGMQGGYYVVKEPFIIYDFSAVPLYLVNRKKIMPTKSDIEKEIATYIKNEIDHCINFTQFVDVEITRGTPAISTELSHSGLSIKAEWPITISKNGLKTTIKDFNTRIETTFYNLYDVCDRFIDKEVGDWGRTHLAYLLDIISEKNLHVELVPWENNITIFILRDNSTQTVETFGKTLKWRFAVQY